MLRRENGLYDVMEKSDTILCDVYATKLTAAHCPKLGQDIFEFFTVLFVFIE